MHKTALSIILFSLSTVPVAIDTQAKLNGLAEKQAESALEQEIDNQKRTSTQQSAEDKITAMERALSGCIPLVDAETGQLLKHLSNNIPIQRIGSVSKVLQNEDVVCSSLGDTAIIRNGVTTETKNVGFKQLDNFQIIYRRYSR